MQFQKYLLVTAIIMSLVVTNEGFFFALIPLLIKAGAIVKPLIVKTAVKPLLVKTLAKPLLVKKIVKPLLVKTIVKAKTVAKPLCKAVFEVGCPAGSVAAAVAATAATNGSAAPAFAAAGSVMGTVGCKVLQGAACKRSIIDRDTILIPFSDNFDNYDYNGDKMIEYHEFMRAVTSSVGLIHLDELMEPFVFADADGNDKIDTDEFQAAPFVFGQLTAGNILKMTGMRTE